MQKILTSLGCIAARYTLCCMVCCGFLLGLMREPAAAGAKAGNSSAAPVTSSSASEQSPVTQKSATTSNIPSFAELEATGAVIGQIQIDNQNIFDLNDPRENNFLFRLANKLHIRTREDTLRRSLLFKSGEPLSLQLIEETERLLRNNRYLYSVHIEATNYQDGVVDIKVTTRDTWTLDPGISLSRQGGANSSSVSLKEYNLLGTGIALGINRSSSVDRKGTEATIANNHAFDGWTIMEYRHRNFDDGKGQSARVERPFYALDTRWAAGISASSNEIIESIYNNGNVVGQYRRQSESGQVYGGMSKGLINGWVQRYSAGLRYQNDAYLTDPSLPPPGFVPPDKKLAGPFVRYEILQNDYAKLKNRNLIERTEYFSLGFNASVDLERASTSFGSTQDLWIYSGAVGNGHLYPGGHNLLWSGYARGQYGANGGDHQVMGVAGKYYYVQDRHGVLFASIAADTVTSGDQSDELLIGGDSGLRGYPLRYQSGVHRALISVEKREYTDWYPFRLFRVGGAVFVDSGRAWGGVNQNTANPGWLSDVGIGLRILSDRSAFGNILHIDLTFPINGGPGIKSHQFSFKTKISF